MADGETQPAMCYPRADQYEYWKERAEEMDMSVSEWMQYMVAAGDKKFDTTVEPDTSNSELRQQRDELRRELRDARQRIDTLEDQLYDSERQTIVEYVRDNPGCSFDDVVRHITKTAPSRINRHLDALLGSELTEDDEQRYYVDDQAE